MQSIKMLTTILAISVMGLSPSVRAQDAVMTPQEIQSAWTGKTVVALIGGGPSAGKVIELQLKADGVAELGGALSDAGTWRLSDKGYCATWKKIRAGQERCFTVVRKGADIQVFNPDGSLNSTVTQVR
jgi:hypothetical protein